MPLSPSGPMVLAINAGSSNIKFALFSTGSPPARLVEGCVDGIGTTSGCFRVTGPGAAESFSRHFAIPERVTASNVLMDWIDEQVGPGALYAIGHLVVHGGPAHWETQPITAALRQDLHELAAFDPKQLPQELLLIDALQRRFPDVPQVACFDSAFHHAMPRVARLLPIPRRYEAQGLRRFGFHGVSCAFLMEELERLAGPEAARGRVILAHLGGGASITAVLDRQSIDTSMGLSQAGGIPMSVRSGDIDPGLAWYLARTERLSPAKLHHMLNHDCGLLGVSETSGDMRMLLEAETDDTRAAEAIALFCYQAAKAVCAMAAALQGLDTLVFSGGIGVHAPEIRARICARLGFIGVQLDPERNAAGAELVSASGGSVGLHVIRTDEERMIARQVLRLLPAGAGAA